MNFRIVVPPGIEAKVVRTDERLPIGVFSSVQIEDRVDSDNRTRKHATFYVPKVIAMPSGKVAGVRFCTAAEWPTAHHYLTADDGNFTF